MKNVNLRLKLIVMNFLQFAVWGAYLISMGRYLGTHGLGDKIGIFYSIQGIVSIFMPALMGIVADRWIPAQRLLGLCHVIAGGAMIALSYVAQSLGDAPSFSALFPLYTLSVAFYMPTLALSNSVAYSGLEQAGEDIVKAFPPIRIFGTIGFIVSMLAVDALGFQETPLQFLLSGGIGILFFFYSFFLPHCATAPRGEKKSLSEAFGLKAFTLFREPKMALFFLFSMLLGINLQITNGFANPYLGAFGELPEYAEAFGVKHSNMLISLSQISETLCILLIPFLLRRLGIKRVMLIAMICWVLRFSLLGAGNPSGGLWLFVLSMIVYGMAFDFFNVSGSLFVDRETDSSMRSSAQGLFILMTNGIGATIGTLGAQWVVNYFVESEHDAVARLEGWATSWYFFAAYALVITILFWIFFRYEGDRQGAQPKKVEHK
ncbi:MAG: MFS transporter [Porphyromonas endodontalis]|uniref:MFS transporter n=1 Tax=Porphyromonas endodontalis TaxID=28124 RepID=UPI003F9F9C64